MQRLLRVRNRPSVSRPCGNACTLLLALFLYKEKSSVFPFPKGFCETFAENVTPINKNLYKGF